MIFRISHKTIKSSIKSKNYLFINPRFWTFKIALENFKFLMPCPLWGTCLRKKSHILKFADCAGHSTSPLKETACPGNFFLSTFREFWVACAVASFCRNHNMPKVIGMEL